MISDILFLLYNVVFAVIYCVAGVAWAAAIHGFIGGAMMVLMITKKLESMYER